MTPFPKFRFHPNWPEGADAVGSKQTCGVCRMPRTKGLQYHSDLGYVCAWCIADGRAYAACPESYKALGFGDARKLFNSFDPKEQVDSDARLIVEQLTPPIPSPQERYWPVRRGMPMVCEGNIWRLDELRSNPLRWNAFSALARKCRDYEAEPEETLAGEIKEGHMWLVMFHAEDQEEYFAMIDAD